MHSLKEPAPRVRAEHYTGGEHGSASLQTLQALQGLRVTPHDSPSVTVPGFPSVTAVLRGWDHKASTKQYAREHDGDADPIFPFWKNDSTVNSLLAPAFQDLLYQKLKGNLSWPVLCLEISTQLIHPQLYKLRLLQLWGYSRCLHQSAEQQVLRRIRHSKICFHYIKTNIQIFWCF